MRRFLSALAVFAAALGPAGCGGHEAAFEGAMLHLVEALDDASIAVGTPLPLDGVVDEVVYVRGGLASIVVTLRTADAVGGVVKGRALERFPLPLPPAPANEAADLPELIGLPLPRVAGPEERPNGYWVQGNQLAIVHGQGQELPAELRLRYTVYAAQLAGTAQAAGFPPREVFGVRTGRGPISSRSIALPTGARVEFALPPVGRGRIEGAFRALAPDGGALNLGVAVTLDAEVLFDERVSTDGGSTPIGSGTRPWVEIERSVRSRRLVVEAKGTPGGLVFFEAPLWSRARNWRDGPNALLIVADGLRVDRLGCYGDRRRITPNIDAFAGIGQRFHEAWSTSTWSLPAMASILTSLYGPEHLATRHDRRLGRGVTTLAEAFQSGGYRAAAITDGGFVTPSFGLDRGFTTFDARGGGAAAVLPRFFEHLDRYGDRPWFVVLHLADATPPFEASEESLEDIALRHSEEAQALPADPAAFRSFAVEGEELPADALAWMRELYDAEVAEVDRQLGVLFDELRERDFFENTAIVLTASHGEELGEHGFLGHGDMPFPEVARVPLIVKLPEGEKAALILREPVSLVDVAPTLLAGAGLRELLPSTTFTGVPLNSGVRSSPVFISRDHPVAGELTASRRDQHLFFRGKGAYAERGGNALYNFFADPGAMANQAQKMRSTVQSSLQRMDKFLESAVPRAEGAESALSGEALEKIDPLPGAKAPIDPSEPAQRGGRGQGVRGQGARGQEGRGQGGRQRPEGADGPRGNKGPRGGGDAAGRPKRERADATPADGSDGDG